GSDDGDHRGEAAGQRLTGLGDGGPALDVAVLGPEEHVPHGEVAVRPPQAVDDRTRAGDRLEAAAVAAPAQRTTLDDPDVPDLPGRTGTSVDQGAVDDQTHADAAGHPDE